MNTKLEKRKRAKQQTAKAAQLFRHQLAWTHGFPLQLIEPDTEESVSNPCVRDAKESRCRGLYWAVSESSISTSRAKLLKLDTGLIQSSRIALNRLTDHYSTCLPQLIQDPIKWDARIRSLLDLLSSILQGRIPSESLLESALASTGKLSSRMDGSWIDRVGRAALFADRHSTNPDSSALLKWLESHRHSLRKLDGLKGRTSNCSSPIQLREQLVLSLIGNRYYLSSADLDRLILCFSRTAIHGIPTRGINEELQAEYSLSKGVRKSLSRKKRQEVKEGSAVSAQRNETRTVLDIAVEQFYAAETFKPRIRRILLKWVALLGDEHLIRNLERIADRHQSEIQRMQRDRQLWKKPQLRTYPKEALKAMLETTPLQKAKLIDDRDTQWLRRIRELLVVDRWKDQPIELTESIIEFLSVAKQRSHLAWWVVATLMEKVGREAIGRQSSHLTAIFRNLTAMVKQSYGVASWTQLFMPLFEAKSPWQQKILIFDPWLESSDHSHQTGNTPPVRTIDSFFQGLSYLLKKGTFPKDRAPVNSLGNVWVHLNDPVKFQEFFIQIADQPPEYAIELEELQALEPFCDSPTDLALLGRSVFDGTIDDDTLRRICSLAKHPLTRNAVRHCLIRGEDNPLEDLGSLIRALFSKESELVSGNAFGFPRIDQTEMEAKWIDQYPMELRPSLRELRTLREDAEVIAVKLLRFDFVDRAKRIRELNYLERELQTDSLGASTRSQLKSRSQRVQQLLDSQPKISPIRIEKLRRKLLSRVNSESMNWLRSELNVALQNHMSEQGLSYSESQLADSRFHRILAGLLNVRQKEKQIGLRLLSLSGAGFSYPELEESANTEFIHRMQDRGLNLDPWLEMKSCWKIPVGDGMELTLRFAKDPYEYLLMGHHFQTCLSPGDVNFFNTISAAVDVNKRVLYIDDPDGSIVGRCLIALGGQGELVRYRVYAHMYHSAISEAIEKALNELAQRMNTTRCSDAKVSCLVSKRWYDDGIVAGELNTQSKIQAFVSEHCNANSSAQQIDSASPRLAELVEDCARIHGPVFAIRQLGISNNNESVELPDWVFEIGYRFVRRLTVDKVYAVQCLASLAWQAQKAEWMDPLLRLISDKQSVWLFRKSICRRFDCYRFHGFDNEKFVEKWIGLLQPHVALRALRISRKKNRIRSDLEEVCKFRRRLLAKTHERLGRERLPELLRA